MKILWLLVSTIALIPLSHAEQNYFRSQNVHLPSLPAPDYWSNGMMDPNSTQNLNAVLGCEFCGELYYHEPPPDDIVFIPPPPLHPIIQASLAEYPSLTKQQNGDSCSYCNLFYNDGEQLSNLDGAGGNINNRVVAILASFTIICSVLCLYLIGFRRSRIIATFTRTTLFKSNQPTQANQHADKNNHNELITDSGVHLSDPCYLQTNRDKNFTSPIISDHVSHKKTAIPSKCWAQPGSIIGRTIRRIPNEYEVPSSQTNSTGTSSAVYADMNNEHNNQRFFSPYNLHTYAEVREILDPEEHFHTSSNSSAMLSESNYDNAVYTHGNCMVENGGAITTALNGSVQMSDFNSMRPVQSMAYGQPTSINHPSLSQATKIHHINSQPIYEQPPQRAQVIITSNNQGVNPTLINYRDRIHNVI